MRRTVVTIFVALLALPFTAPEAQGHADSATREAREQALRARFERRVQQVLGASDEQMRRLVPINRHFEGERRVMLRQEREVRVELRQALGAGAPDETRVGALLDRLLELQQRRLDLVRREQRDLAAVLTPSQRARYLVLQEEIRQRVEGMRDERGRRPRRRP